MDFVLTGAPIAEDTSETSSYVSSKEGGKKAAE